MISLDNIAFKQLNSIKEAKDILKHGNFIGVSDSSGLIPPGKVFLTGMGNHAPKEVFLTRVSHSFLNSCDYVEYL